MSANQDKKTPPPPPPPPLRNVKGGAEQSSVKIVSNIPKKK
jgi:hypothetical protein